MLSLSEIKTFYPEKLQVFESFVLREYLQYKILEIVFESDFKDQLCFLGGTCLRIVHQNQRFSEDLDFDHFGLAEKEFDAITTHISKELQLLGYSVEMRNVHKGAYHCYLKFPSLLFHEGLSGHKEDKILIQLDTEPHHFKYKPETPILNKFDVFTQINCTPQDLLLAQKFYAVINRKRNKGRDFFDIVFLLGKGVKPNYHYLEQKIGITNETQLKENTLEKCNQLNMAAMAKDVEPFLFEPKETKKVSLFADYLKQVKLF